MGKCKACAATLVWAKTINGRAIPLDAVDPSTGNIRVVDGIAHVGQPGTGHYVSHFVRCPGANLFRRPR